MLPEHYRYTFSGMLGSMTCTCTLCGCTVNPDNDTIRTHDVFHNMLAMLLKEHYNSDQN